MFYIAPINPGEGLFIKHIRAPSIKNNSTRLASNLALSYCFVSVSNLTLIKLSTIVLPIVSENNIHEIFSSGSSGNISFAFYRFFIINLKTFFSLRN